MIILNKIKIFLKKDLRKKLTFFKIYPNFFHAKGLRSVYSKLVFNLIFKEYFNFKKKYLFKEIFIKRNTDVKKNFLVSLPRSGSMVSRLMLKSYFELKYKIGNGIPKYDSLNNKWLFTTSIVSDDTLHNAIFTSNENLNNLDFYIDKTEFEKKKIIFSRYPVTNIDLYSIKQAHPVIILRNPYDQILSYYVNHDRDFDKKNLINKKLLENIYLTNLKFYKYWYENLRSKKIDVDYMIIKFEELVKTPELSLDKMLRFYNFEIDMNLVKKSAEIHKKENTLELLGDIKIREIRFTDQKRKDQIKEKILYELSIIDKDLLKYYNLLSDQKN